MHITLRNNLDEFQRVNAFLADFLEAYPVSDHVAYQLRLVVEELVSNVIRHGFSPGQSAEIEVCLCRGPTSLMLTIEDSGQPFDPTDREAPQQLADSYENRPVGGLGIFLVQLAVQRFDYQRIGDQNHTEIEINLDSTP